MEIWTTNKKYDISVKMHENINKIKNTYTMVSIYNIT